MKADRKKYSKNVAQVTNEKGSEYLTFPAAAKMLGVVERTARNLARRGTLKTFTFGAGMKRKVLRSSVLALLAKKQEA